MKKIMLLMAMGCCFTAPLAYADTDDSGFQTGDNEGLFEPNECTAKNAISCTGEDPATDVISTPSKPYGKQDATARKKCKHHRHRAKAVVIRELPAQDF